MTRVHFGDTRSQDAAKRGEVIDKWEAWWKDVGVHRQVERGKRGVRDAEAWKLVSGERGLALPQEKVVIPHVYELAVNFRSGDYGGVTSETITVKRRGGHAELVRAYATRSGGPVIQEKWLPFSVEEADRAVRAIGYLIDQPWLLNNEAEIEKRYWESEKDKSKGGRGFGESRSKIQGRESYGESYYPTVRYELLDGEGRVWWNAEVDRWHGGNPERFNQTHVAAPGVVFPFLTSQYPESERRAAGKEKGWRAQ